MASKSMTPGYWFGKVPCLMFLQCFNSDNLGDKTDILPTIKPKPDLALLLRCHPVSSAVLHNSLCLTQQQ